MQGNVDTKTLNSSCTTKKISDRVIQASVDNFLKAPERVPLNFRSRFPYGKFSDENFLRAGPRRARLCLWQNSHMAPGFESRRDIKQFMSLPAQNLQIKKPLSRFLYL